VKVPGGGWAITALGDDAKTKCCGNYNEMMTMCKNRSGQVGFTTNNNNNNNQTTAAAAALSSELALPTSNETIGVRLLSGFSADMLRCLVVSEEEEEAMKVAAEAEKAAAQAKANAEAAAAAAVAGGGGGVVLSESQTKMLQLAMEAQRIAQDKADEALQAKIAAASPGAKLQRTLRSERYHSVRVVAAEVGENDLAGYVAPMDWVKV